MCKNIREVINCYFPRETGVRIVAEPGRFFAETCGTLYTRVIGRREVTHSMLQNSTHGSVPETSVENDSLEKFDSYVYIVNGGIWSSLNFILRDPTEYKVPLQQLIPGKGPKMPSVIFGPTCDGIDRITDIFHTEKSEIGDWLVRPNSGAYGRVYESNFNSMPIVKPIHTISEYNIKYLKLPM